MNGRQTEQPTHLYLVGCSRRPRALSILFCLKTLRTSFILTLIFRIKIFLSEIKENTSVRSAESEERLIVLSTLACILLSAGCERGKFCEMGPGLVTLECRGTEWYIVRNSIRTLQTGF